MPIEEKPQVLTVDDKSFIHSAVTRTRWDRASGQRVTERCPATTPSMAEYIRLLDSKAWKYPIQINYVSKPPDMRRLAARLPSHDFVLDLEVGAVDSNGDGIVLNATLKPVWGRPLMQDGTS